MENVDSDAKKAPAIKVSIYLNYEVLPSYAICDALLVINISHSLMEVKLFLYKKKLEIDLQLLVQ